MTLRQSSGGGLCRRGRWACTAVLRAVALWSGLAGATGCAVSLPPAPPRLAPDPPGPSGLAHDEPPPLRVRPGDVLTLELDTTPPRTLEGVVVEADGRAHLPIVGDEVDIGGATLAEAEARLGQALRDIDRLAQVHVRVERPAGQRVTVLGAVQERGTLSLTPGMRLAEALAMSGGLRTTVSPLDGAPVPLADPDNAVVVRDGARLPIDVSKAIAGDRAHNVFLRPGDHIYVPRHRQPAIGVAGQVGEPGLFLYWPGMRLSEALAVAGGITVGGDKSDIRLVRGSVEAPDVYRADFAAIVDGEAPDVELERGDFVFVTDHPLEDLGEVMGLLGSFTGLVSTAVLVALVASQ